MMAKIDTLAVDLGAFLTDLNPLIKMRIINVKNANRIYNPEFECSHIGNLGANICAKSNNFKAAKYWRQILITVLLCRAALSCQYAHVT